MSTPNEATERKFIIRPRPNAVHLITATVQFCRIFKEPLIYSHMAATVAWRDEMRGVTRRQGLFSLTSGTTRQFARQAPSHMGCGQIGCSLASTAWRQSPGYDLRRTRRDLPDLTRNAAHGGINQRFLKTSLPLQGGYGFVRRFTTRGLDRPLGLVRPPVAASLINALHHFWNCSGGMAPLVGSLRRISARLCLKLSVSGGRCRDSAASSISLRTT